jgi:hypothetical protein
MIETNHLWAFFALASTMPYPWRKGSVIRPEWSAFKYGWLIRIRPGLLGASRARGVRVVNIWNWKLGPTNGCAANGRAPPP